MNLVETLKQAEEEFADLHRVYDGKRAHTKAQEKNAAKKMAETYLGGKCEGKMLKALGEPLLAALLAALGPGEISLSPSLKAIFKSFEDALSESEEIGSKDSQNLLFSWDIISKEVKAGPLVEPVIKKILEAGEEQFLLRVLFLVSRLTKEEKNE